MADVDELGTFAESRPAVTVLLAEDEPLVRWDIADRLREEGWHVVEVSSADAGIRFLMSDAEIDLVLTDINMPGEKNGLALASFARRRSGIKIVLMSGVPAKLIPGFDETHKDMFITKPFDIETMVDSLKDLLRNDREGDNVAPA